MSVSQIQIKFHQLTFLSNLEMLKKDKHKKTNQCIFKFKKMLEVFSSIASKLLSVL